MNQKEKMEYIEKKLIEQDRKLDAQDVKLDKLLFYFENDDTTGKKGFYQELKDLKKVVYELADNERIFRGQLKLFSFIAGGLSGLMVILVEYFLTK